jgi:hypothetical protein
MTRSVTSIGTLMTVTSATAAASPGFEVTDDDPMSEVAEHALEYATHGAAAAYDRDRQDVGLRGEFSLQCGLVVATRAQQDAEQGLDLAAREAHLLGTSAPVLEDLALAFGVADPQVVLPLVGGDLGNDRHPASSHLEQLVVERIDHGAEEGKRASGGL